MVAKKPTRKVGRPRKKRLESVYDPPETEEEIGSDQEIASPPPEIVKPDWLIKEAHEVWESVLPTIRLHPAKTFLFASFCQTIGRAIWAERKLAERGHTHKELRNGEYRPYPEFKMREASWKEALKIAKELGITQLVLPGSGGAGSTARGGTESALDPVDDFIFNGAPSPIKLQ